jgi:ATP/maltotriose-dependent transcriptional regulator MalT
VKPGFERRVISVTLQSVALTADEQAVLRCLPSQMAFDEIGVELGMAKGTARPLAISIYRKLGVACRREAIDSTGV